MNVDAAGSFLRYHYMVLLLKLLNDYIDELFLLKEI